MRLLYGGFESWLTGAEIYDATNPYRANLPRLKVAPNSQGALPYAGPGTLLDYLGTD